MRHTSSPEQGTTKVVDNGDGTFRIDFSSSASGQWELDVLLDSAPIAGSPFTVTLAWRMSTISLVAIAGSAVGLLLLVGAAFVFIRRRRRPQFTWERL